MTLRARASRQQAGESFPEAVAQWRLTLRTEVKTTSSLPTSVFHGRDATLEAMLAASTEAMLARLQTPSRAANAGAAAVAGQRLERIGVAELQVLPILLRAGGDRPPRIDDHARTTTGRYLRRNSRVWSQRLNTALRSRYSDLASA